MKQKRSTPKRGFGHQVWNQDQSSGAESDISSIMSGRRENWDTEDSSWHRSMGPATWDNRDLGGPFNNSALVETIKRVGHKNDDLD